MKVIHGAVAVSDSGEEVMRFLLRDELMPARFLSLSSFISLLCYTYITRKHVLPIVENMVHMPLLSNALVEARAHSDHLPLEIPCMDS